MTTNYDIIIIGGGIIGHSIAAHLANEKLKIAVVNSNNLGMPASIAAAGLLTPYQSSESEAHLLKDLFIKSFEYFPAFYELIQSHSNINLGYKRPGSLYLIFSNFEFAQKENEIKELKNRIDKNFSFINKQEIPKIEPLITKEVLGAYYYPEEGYINNPKFLKAISTYCYEKKVAFINTEVKEINLTKSKVENITLSNKENISANKYVLCNGVWADKFLQKIYNTNKKFIHAIKGEILQVEAPEEAALNSVVFCSDGYIVYRPKTNQFEKSSFLIGSTNEEVELNNGDHFTNTISGISYLLSLSQKIIPTLKNNSILNMWAGLRPQTQDSLPAMGQVEEVKNLFYALGHYRNGILMGAYTGKLLKELILNSTTDYDIKSFKIERFLETKSNKQLVINH